MTIATAKNTPRNSYTASGSQTDFTIGFEFFSVNDIKVYKNGTLMTYNASPSSNTQYKITGTASGSDSAYEFGAGGTVTFGSGLSASDSVVIIRDIVIERTTDFTPSGTFDIQTLNTELDKIYALIAEQDQQSARSVKLLDTDTVSVTTTLPSKADRASKQFEFDSDGNVTVGTGTIGVTASADELNILDGCTLTTTELNQFDGFSIADEDDLSSNSATKLSTQQSIKAYVDSQIATEDTIQELNDTDISSLASGHILIWDGSDSFDNKPISGDVTLASTGAITIANNAVETAMINADAVTNAKIADDSIDSEHYVDGSIDTAHIGDLQVTTAKIAADAITGAKLADDAVNSEHYTDGSIDTAHIGDDQVTNAKIAADAITSTEIADDAISEEHLDPTVISGLSDTTIASDDHLMFFDATDNQLKKVDAAELGVGTALTEIVGDTSPQLGGTLDVNGNTIDMNGLADGLILDTDGDTTISAPTDDQIDIEIGGADDFTFTANKFTALSGSDIEIASGATITNNGTATGFGTPLRPNVEPLIINGEMQISVKGDQTGITGTHFVVDRFAVRQDANFGTWSTTRDNDVPTGKGFSHSLKMDCTTADTSLGADDDSKIDYRFEGQHLQLLKKGTSSAEKVTLAFYVKSAKTGTYTVELFDNDNDRQCSKTYTISSANTWEQKVINFPADTTGTLGNDNAHSLSINWYLGAGSNFTSGTLNSSSFASTTKANRVSSSQVNLADSTSNDWFLTGVQFEVGEYTASTLPAFQHQMIEDTQRRCSRYVQKIASSNNQGVGEGFSSDGTGRGATMIPFLPMRASPTVTSSAASTFKFQQGVTTSGNGTGFIVKSVNNNQGANQGQSYGVGLFRVHLDVSVSGMAQDGRFCRGVSNGDSFVIVDAEL